MYVSLPSWHTKRLIVTHMSQDTLARLEDLPFEHAEDSMVIQL